MTVGLGDAAALSLLASLSESPSPRPSSTQSGSSIVILFLSRESFLIRLATGLPASRSSLIAQSVFIDMLAIAHFQGTIQSRLFESTDEQQRRMQQECLTHAPQLMAQHKGTSWDFPAMMLDT